MWKSLAAPEAVRRLLVPSVEMLPGLHMNHPIPKDMRCEQMHLLETMNSLISRGLASMIVCHCGLFIVWAGEKTSCVSWGVFLLELPALKRWLSEVIIDFKVTAVGHTANRMLSVRLCANSSFFPFCSQVLTLSRDSCNNEGSVVRLAYGRFMLQCLRILRQQALIRNVLGARSVRADEVFSD